MKAHSIIKMGTRWKLQPTNKSSIDGKERNEMMYELHLRNRLLWKKASILSLALLICLLLFSGSVFASENSGAGGNQTANLAVNPGFEEPLHEGEIPGWRQTFGTGNAHVAFERTDAAKHEGNYSLRLQDSAADAPLGVESDKFPVSGGDAYAASAMFLVEEARLGIYLQFFDESGVRIAYSTGWVSATDGEWVKGEASAIAPEEAVSGSVLLYSSVPDQGIGYVDSVQVKRNRLGKFEDLGTPIINFIHNASELGMEDGRPVSYSVVKGADNNTVFAVIDVLTAKVVKTIPMPGVEGAWAIETASDGSVYIGTHYDGSLYQYAPGGDHLVNLGRLGEETHVWSLAAGADGKIYAGTYPNGSVFEYDPAADQIRLLGRMHPTERYVRSLAYNPDLNVLYAGVGGSEAHLYKIDLDTGAKEELLSQLIPEDQASYDFTYSLGYALGKLFVRVNKPDQLLIVDAATDALEYYDPTVTISMGQNTLAVKPGDDSTIYFGGYRLYAYDLNSQTFTQNVYPNGATWASFYDADFMELNHPEWPGVTLVGATEKGKLLLVDLDSGKMETAQVDNFGSPVLIQSLSTGFDGNIYIGGYLGATGFISYRPETDDYTPLREFGQVEKAASVGDKLYIGTYGNARIHEYDPSQPWSAGTNPRRVAELISHGQDRPFALVGVDEQNKLYIGSVADYGTHQGALAIYDTVSGSIEVYDDIVQDQGIVSLAYHDGMIYGGTTIYGGLGTSGPAADEAKLFVFDTQTKQKVFETAPAPGRQVVSGLTVGPDGHIWGVAEDHIFKFDPDTRQFVYNASHLGRYPASTGTVWVDAFLELGVDGNIYGTNRRGHFFMIDPDSMTFMSIQSGAGNYLTQDFYGNLYMASGPYLKRYVLPADDASISRFIEQEAEAGRLPHPVMMQLANRLRQAVHHMEKQHVNQVLHHLEKMLEHLHTDAVAHALPERTKLALDQQIRTMMADWER